jgi:hypothetical protein
MTGFGKPKPTQADKLVERMVHHCRKRNPEALDRLLDSVHVGHTRQESERLSYWLNRQPISIRSLREYLIWKY